jgi:hypothetical protein
MWYSAALLFKSSHTPNRNFDALWEEQIVLVEASTETDAHVRMVPNCFLGFSRIPRWSASRPLFLNDDRELN